MSQYGIIITDWNIWKYISLKRWRFLSVIRCCHPQFPFQLLSSVRVSHVTTHVKRKSGKRGNAYYLGCLKDYCLSWGDSPHHWDCWRSGRRPPPCPDGPAAICAATLAGHCRSALNCPSPPLIQTGGGSRWKLSNLQKCPAVVSTISDIHQWQMNGTWQAQ